MACMSLFFTRPRFYSSSLLHPICDFTEIFQVRAKVDHREPFKNLTGVFFNFEKPGTKCLVLTDAQCSQILITFFLYILDHYLYASNHEWDQENIYTQLEGFSETSEQSGA